MSTISSKGGGGKAPDEEKLNIPAFVKITNTSGFAIPASVLNRAWVALSQQFVNRNEAVASNLDNNFLAFLWNHVLGNAPVSPVTVATMTTYANTVYDANIGHNFTTCIIPEVFWQKTGYQTTRLEKKMGEIEGFIDLRIWVEGYENSSLSASHSLPSSNYTIPYIYIGTTYGQTVWSTDFLYQRMKAHNETITRIFTKDPEALQIEHDSIDTLCCKTSIDGEAPIISPTHDDLYKFSKDSHRFLIQTCLNNDTHNCIANMEGTNPKFPNFNSVSKLYYGLEVIPMSSRGFSRLEPVMAIQKPPKAKAGKGKRRRAKRKIDGMEQAGEASSVATVQAEITETKSDETTNVEETLEAKRKIGGVEQAGEASSVSAIQAEIAEINYETTKVEETLEASTEDNDLESTIDETPDVTHLLEEATANKTEARIPEPIKDGKGIIANQRQTNLRVPTSGHGQESSRFTAQSEDQAGQLTQGQTIPEVSVSVSALAARNEAILSTTIAKTGTSVAKKSESQAVAPARHTTSSQTDAPTGDTASSQAAVKDAVTLQAAAPVEVQVISQAIAAASSSSNHIGAHIASTHGPQFINEDRARVIAELRAQPPPPSLEEVRARRASIKEERREERRQSIDFIRMRTLSRASALGISMTSANPSDSGPLPETTTQGNETTNQSVDPPRALEQVSETTSDSTANDGNIADLHLKLPPPTGQASGPTPNEADEATSIADASLKLPRSVDDSSKYTNPISVSPSHLAQLSSPVAQENVKPRRGKWVAPLPEQQEWVPVSRPPGPSAAASKKKNHRDAKPVKPSVESRVSLGTQTDTGFISCSVGTQTETGVATSIAEDLEPGTGPAPTRENESAGHGNTKPPPSFTSRASLQRELELTSIVEDPALGQDRGGEYARGILTMAAPSTAHSHLVAELRGAGVPPSALTSLSWSGLEGHEATGCRQQPVGIHLEVETVTIGGVTFEARRRGSQHRVAASMPKLELDW
ncbi:hypothetical protein VF21_04456 [Pseudogymnoascus sp. 05NY08]|nr:hypothetical protein VF21_04456 [Pseudogymnoascus sp. 05NY08]